MSRICRCVLGLVGLIGAACGPRPDAEPPVVAGPPPPPRQAPAGSARPVLVGEMCPTAAAGRPAVRPLFLRGEAWTERTDEVAAPIARRGARQFSVLGWDGRRAGLFSVVGAATLDGTVAAIGGYAGRSPCEKPRGVGGAAGTSDQDCVAALRNCGVAVSVIEATGGFTARPVDEDPEPADFDVGGACLAGGKLLVDIDQDGVLEAFPAAGFVESGGGPAAEVTSIDAAGGRCTARFAIRAALASPTGMDVVGVADFDDDGRKEIVAAFQVGGRQTWALYSATASAARLDRVATAPVWSR